MSTGDFSCCELNLTFPHGRLTGCASPGLSANTARHHRAAVQSNKVYLPQELLLVSISLASRQINAIRSTAEE